MDAFFCWFGEVADKATSNPAFLLIFNIALIALWTTFGTDIANIFISIVTAGIVLVSAGAARRSWKALHAKIDELIHALNEARDDLAGIESKSEREIEEIRS